MYVSSQEKKEGGGKRTMSASVMYFIFTFVVEHKDKTSVWGRGGILTTGECFVLNFTPCEMGLWKAVERAQCLIICTHTLVNVHIHH